VHVLSNAIIRVTGQPEAGPLPAKVKLVVTCDWPDSPDVTVEEDDEQVTLTTPKVQVRVGEGQGRPMVADDDDDDDDVRVVQVKVDKRQNNTITFIDPRSGSVLLREAEGGRRLADKRTDPCSQAEVYTVEQTWEAGEDEAIYGA
jgi:hypothetical protein